MTEHPKDHVVARARCKGSTYAVLYLIAERVQARNGFEFWESLDNLAERAHLNRDTVRKAVRRLVTEGWLDVVKESKGRTPGRYRFLFQPADLAGVEAESNPRIHAAQPADLAVQPADPDAQPADLGLQPADLEGLTKEPSRTELQPRGELAPLTVGLVHSGAQLATFARRIIAEEQPTRPNKPRSTDAATGDRWLRDLASAGDPARALHEVEPILRWALHHHWFGHQTSSLTDIVDQWPKIVAQFHADRSPQPVKPSAAQSSGLQSLSRVMGAMPAPPLELEREVS